MSNQQNIAMNATEPDGASILDRMRDVYETYLHLPAGAAEIMAVWTLGTHSHRKAEIFPRMLFTSPYEKCGKSVALTLMGHICWNSLVVSDATRAAVFRWIDQNPSTVLLDEIDTYLNDDYRALLNAGYKRHGSQVLRCDGEKNESRRFNTYAPIVLAGIGGLNPKTFAPLLSRTITVRLDRAPADASIKRFTANDKESLEEVQALERDEISPSR